MAAGGVRAGAEEETGEEGVAEEEVAGGAPSNEVEELAGCRGERARGERPC